MVDKKYFSLRLSILVIFLTTFILMMGTLIGLSTYNFYQSISYISDKLILNTVDIIMKELSLEIAPALTSAKLTKPLLEKDIIKGDEMIGYTTYTAKYLPNLHNLKYPARLVIWGDANGNAIAAVQQPDDSYSSVVTTAKGDTNYQIDRDPNLKFISKERTTFIYDPRERPWYKKALESQTTSWTDLYYNKPYNNATVALAVPIYDHKSKLKGIFGIEIKLVRLSAFLSSLEIGNGVAFIINRKGELIAFPGMTKDVFTEQRLEPDREKILNIFGKPWVNNAYEQFVETKETHFNFEYKSENYIASFKPIEEFSEYGWMIGVVVPEKDFVGSMKRTNRLITLLSLIILILGALTISYFSKRIAFPIQTLVKETEKIKMFILDTSQPTNSIIKEVHQLTDAIYSMKNNLRSFEKYIPRNLVRQLIETGKDSIKGGVERPLTIFFSDIRNFTTISEEMSAKELMLYLSDYLEAMSSLIIFYSGTIDKYIGDSIMAFWGAPVNDPDHSKHACLAALKCQEKLEELNSLWEKEGKKPLITRIGIHTGTVLVGNIGSSERLNYTILGDAVNLASRLEKINKIYHTKILISEMVVDEIRDSLCYRLVDRIKVRGKTQENCIYELLAESSNKLKFNLSLYDEQFEQGFKAYEQQLWSKAIKFFESCLQIYPADGVSPVFIQRCKEFKKSPPDSSWNGTWSEQDIS